MGLSIEEAISRMPQWKGKTITTAYLTEGITNQNVRVTVEGEPFVVRLAGENTELLGIHRDHEYAAHLAAAALGIAPEVIHFIRPEGCLITRFIHGRALSLEVITRPENIQRVAAALHKVHSLESIPGQFSPFRTVEAYAETARDLGIVFPGGFDRLLKSMRTLEMAYLKNRFTPRPCHNDLLNANFLDDGRIRILDWEYAGMGDVFFDLANFSSNHELNVAQDRLLLGYYFGETTPVQLSRLNLMKVMSGFREAMWGLVQTGISKLDFDFHGYAGKYFSLTDNRIQDQSFERCLREVDADV
jgi:thiamine kinase-like enzyme